MKNVLRFVVLACSTVRLLPHLLALRCLGEDNPAWGDIRRWRDVLYPGSGSASNYLVFIRLMTHYPAFRNLFYFRLGWPAHLLALLCPQMTTLFIGAGKIGPGLFIQHGFATIIAADEIGENCWINQQVTIGYSNDTDRPTLGRNVTISAGAKVIGKVMIGDNSKVGANAVVVKNVPSDVTVVGVPASIVRRNGKRVDESL